MLEAILAPGRSLEALRLDWTAIHDASAKRASIESPEGFPHLRQHRRIRIGSGEIHRRVLGRDAAIARISGNIEYLIAAVLHFAIDA